MRFDNCLFCWKPLSVAAGDSRKYGTCKECSRYEDWSAYLDAHPEERITVMRRIVSEENSEQVDSSPSLNTAHDIPTDIGLNRRGALIAG